MFIIDRIRYKPKGKIEVYVYTPLRLSENSLADNQSVFKYHNTIRKNIDKSDT